MFLLEWDFVEKKFVYNRSTFHPRRAEKVAATRPDATGQRKQEGHNNG